MNLTLAGRYRSRRDAQPRKASSPIRLTPSGILSLLRPEHPQKTWRPMNFTPLGISVLIMLLQPLISPSPILMNPSGIVTYYSLPQYYSRTLFSISKFPVIATLGLPPYFKSGSFPAVLCRGSLSTFFSADNRKNCRSRSEQQRDHHPVRGIRPLSDPERRFPDLEKRKRR